MASKASIGGHPVHPMLIPFPLALWTTSFLTDVLFYFRRGASLPLISKFLLAAGCLGAIAAAIPGFIDWMSIKHKDVKKTRTGRAFECYRAADLCREPLPKMNSGGVALVGSA